MENSQVRASWIDLGRHFSGRESSRRESSTWLCGILYTVSYTVTTATRIYTPVASNSAQRQLDQSNIPVNNGEAQYSLDFSFSEVLLVGFCEFLS